MEATLAQLAGLLGGVLENAQPRHKVSGLKGLEEAGPEDISFLANPRYAKFLPGCKAGVVLVSKDQEIPPGLPVLRVENPYLAYAKILTMATQKPYKATGVHPSAVVEGSASLGKDVSIHALAYVGENAVLGDRVVLHPGAYVGGRAQIGDDTVLHPKVVVEHGCIIGKRCIIHSGAVIGADGFGFVPGESHYKIPQLGIVQIDDDVEIGANTTVDRAALNRTWIQQGVKIDNLVQIAHNCVIGEHTLITAQVGISGSTKLGKRVIVGGQAGLVGHIEIGDNTQIAAQTGIMGSLPADSAVMGYPAMPLKLFLKTSALLKRLPEMLERIKKLENEKK